MQIIPDPLFAALMTLPFAVTLFGLWKILLEPMRAYLEGREHAAVGVRAEARKLDHEAETKLADIEIRLAKAREGAAARREALRRQALSAEQTAIDAARRQAEGKVGEALAVLGQESQAARTALRASGEQLSHEIAGRVLGRDVAA
jgi:F-type H+-transporting ATPase subunit b